MLATAITAAAIAFVTGGVSTGMAVESSRKQESTSSKAKKVQTTALVEEQEKERLAEEKASGMAAQRGVARRDMVGTSQGVLGNASVGRAGILGNPPL